MTVWSGLDNGLQKSTKQISEPEERHRVSDKIFPKLMVLRPFNDVVHMDGDENISPERCSP